MPRLVLPSVPITLGIRCRLRPARLPGTRLSFVSHRCSAFSLAFTHPRPLPADVLPLQYDASAVIKLRSRDFTLVETPLQLQSMLRDLAQVESLAIDCEGVHLGQPQVRAEQGRRGRMRTGEGGGGRRRADGS